MQQQQPEISIVIAAYNEAEAIGRVMSQTTRVMDRLNLQYEIIVVDDGSTDTTKKVASTYNAKVISDGKNHGKGYSVRKAFQQAQGNIIVTIDADGEHKPEDIPKLIHLLHNGTDVAAGSRFLGNGKGFTTRLNVIGNKLMNLTITMLTGKYITDSQTGFRAFKKAFLEQVNLESNGFEIEAEITVKSLRNGFKLKEVPISCERREGGKSKIRIAFDSMKIFRTIVRSNFTPITHESYSHKTHVAWNVSTQLLEPGLIIQD